MYNILNRKIVHISAEKWQTIFNTREIEWKKIYQQCTKYSKNIKLFWFQYRIIHRILATNTFLYKIKLKDSNVFSFCEEEPETIEHLLWGFHKVSDLWHKLNNWIFEMTCIEIPLNLEIVVFGFFKNLEHNFVKNIKIVLLTKFRYL